MENSCEVSVPASLRGATVLTIATMLPFDLPAVRRKKLIVDFDGGNQSSNTSIMELSPILGDGRAGQAAAIAG